MSNLVVLPDNESLSQLNKLFSNLNYYINDVWDDQGDPRMVHYPFMTSGPWTVLTVVISYLYFVKFYGPAMMASRSPFALKYLMVSYNFTMVFLSGWMFYEGCKFLNFGIDTWGCPRSNYTSEDPATRRFLFVAWAFFFSKLVELSDTIFMVLRKKDHQISTLHIIHHSIVPISVWLGLKFAPIGANAWFPLINSFVHTVMYTYFGLMALGDSLSLKIQYKLKHYKPWITRVQIAQFCIAIVHCLVAACQSNCIFPKTFFFLNLGNALLFLGLFSNFYHRCYSTSKIASELSKIKKQAQSTLVPGKIE